MKSLIRPVVFVVATAGMTGVSYAVKDVPAANKVLAFFGAWFIAHQAYKFCEWAVTKVIGDDK